MVDPNVSRFMRCHFGPLSESCIVIAVHCHISATFWWFKESSRPFLPCVLVFGSLCPSLQVTGKRSAREFARLVGVVIDNPVIGRSWPGSKCCCLLAWCWPGARCLHPRCTATTRRLCLRSCRSRSALGLPMPGCSCGYRCNGCCGVCCACTFCP